MILPLRDEIQRSWWTRVLLRIRRQFVNLVMCSVGCVEEGGGSADGMMNYEEALSLTQG